MQATSLPGTRSSAPIHGVRHTLPDAGLPDLACDCHVHVYGERQRYPLALQRVFTPRDALLEQLLEHQDALGFQRVVIVTPSAYGVDNRCTMDSIARIDAGGAGQARGVAVIDPAQISDTQLRTMHVSGIRGVRINLETYGKSDPAAAGLALQAAAARVAFLGWHVQTFTNVGVIAALRDVIAALPVPLVIDHFGKAMAKDGPAAPGMRVICDLLASGKVWVKMSGAHRISELPDFTDVEAMVQALLAANADQLVWGSDWPHTGAWNNEPMRPDVINEFHPIDDGHAVNRLRRWLGSAGYQKKVLVDNPARLYDFD